MLSINRLRDKTHHPNILYIRTNRKSVVFLSIHAFRITNCQKRSVGIRSSYFSVPTYPFLKSKVLYLYMSGGPGAM